jgi:hypothetical protein
MQFIILALFAFFSFACGGEASRGGEILEVTIGPELAPCVGLAPRTCMVVDGELFYDPIEGLDYEPGYRYRIRMEQYEAWPDREEPSADASKYAYRLIEVIEKVKAP